MAECITHYEKHVLEGNEFEVGYDATSYRIGGKRIWLASGEIHYFRTPAALWKDRLLKARRAGLNCISTYIAWNAHEPNEGEFDFSGDLDIGAFVRTAGELGLFVILRPGPYICSEWDFGGFPAWLTREEGILYRTNDERYTHFYRRFFREALPPLARLDASRGGNIVLIQNENEHFMSGIPGRTDYFRDIDASFREAGFRIPIVHCNRFAGGEPSGAIECVNTWDDPVGDLRHMRELQPRAPLLVTEFWCGGLDSWGRGRGTKSTREVVRKSIEILGCGAQNNYYMWHGGTNFAFWGGRLQYDPFFHMITSYDLDSPLGEGGELTPKYYGTKLVTTLASSMGASFADQRWKGTGVTAEGATVLETSSESGEGAWYTVSAPAGASLREATLPLPGGAELLVPLEPYGAAIVPYGLRIGDRHRLDYANVMPLGRFGNLLVLHGPAHAEAVFSVDGRRRSQRIPDAPQPLCFRFEACCVVLMNTRTAERSWWVDDALIVGPEYVGEGPGGIAASAGGERYCMLDKDGVLTWVTAPSSASRPNVLARMDRWTLVSVCGEPADVERFVPVEGPTDLTMLGIYYGYGWYRMAFRSQEERNVLLRLPLCEDRITLFVNGAPAGVWGYGPGASTEGVPAALRAGENVVVAFAENLGRMTHSWRIGEPKGIVRHLYDSKRVEFTSPEWSAAAFEPEMIPSLPGHLNQDHRLPDFATMPLRRAVLAFESDEVSDIHLTFAVDHPVLVRCNGHDIGLFENPGKGYGDVVIAGSKLTRDNRLELFLWGDVQEEQALRSLRMFALTTPLTADAAWSFAPWRRPEKDDPEATAADGRPAWYRAEFGEADASGPTYLRLGEGWKGQIYFNGRHVGRYWNIAPQQDYYIPECWYESRNTLLLFDERGIAPEGAEIVVRREWTAEREADPALDVVQDSERA